MFVVLRSSPECENSDANETHGHYEGGAAPNRDSGACVFLRNPSLRPRSIVVCEFRPDLSPRHVRDLRSRRRSYRREPCGINWRERQQQPPASSAGLDVSIWPRAILYVLGVGHG